MILDFYLGISRTVVIAISVLASGYYLREFCRRIDWPWTVILNNHIFYMPFVIYLSRTGKFLSNLFCSHKFHKIENYFIFRGTEKKLSHLTKNYSTFYLSRLEIRDPEKNLSQILGSKKHRIPDTYPQH